ncbi:hypothetical protein GCM10010317_050770 [Streptomyces mirabilis]|nr:hypothetical protein GCM10010317_050770 [Streptomyces mirabilis]
MEGSGPTGLRIDPTAQTVREIHAGARPTRRPERQLFRIIIPAHRSSCPHTAPSRLPGLPGPALRPTGAPLQGRGAVTLCGSAAWARPAPTAPQTKEPVWGRGEKPLLRASEETA